jgi:polysaccharide biosynthesis transport protein
MPQSHEGSGHYPDYPSDAGEGGQGGGGLAQFAGAVRRRWWLVVLGTGLVFGAAWFLVPRDHVLFEAAAVVRLDDTRQTFAATAAEGGMADFRSAEYMLSQVHVIRSQSLMGEVVERDPSLRLQSPDGLPAGLIRDVAVSPGPLTDTLALRFGSDGFEVRTRDGVVGGRYGQPVEAGGVRFTLAQPPQDVTEARVAVLTRQQAIDVVASRLRVFPRDRSAILDIFYVDPDHGRAQVVVNSVAQLYQAYNTRSVQDQARRRREFLQEQLVEGEGSLARAQQVLRDYQAADRSFGSRERFQAEQAGLIGLDAQRRQLEDERRTFESFLVRVGQARDERIDQELRTLMSAPGIGASPLLSQLFSQLAEYQLERERQLASGRSPKHPKVQQLTVPTSSARASIADAARTQVAALDQRIASIDQQRERSLVALRAIPDVGMEEVGLVQEVETARGAVATLRAEYHRARMSESLDVGQVQILDLAATATPRVQGRRTQALVIALVFGLLLGSGGALLLEATNTSVRGRNEMEGILSVPGLGVIPRIEPVDGTGAKNRTRLLRRSPVPAKTNGKGAHGEIMHRDFDSLAAEAYRMLRTNLVFLKPHGELRTMVVTSASSGEGKTTTAANLAVAFAKQGQRVLLVDCDLRRPRLHTLFHVQRSSGFVELLLGTATPGDAIQPTPVERLSILPRGKFDERAPEMLSGARTRQLIEKLSGMFDLVIFDTSPTLLTADAKALAPNTDGVLFVVRAGKTPREAARQALQQLNVVGAQVLGFVLNDPDATAEYYGEYRYAGEYYAVEA